MNIEAATQALLIRTGNEPMQPVKPGFATEDVNQWLALNEKTRKQVEEMWIDIQRVLKDTTLSPEGKQKKLATLGATVVKDFAWLGRVLRDTDAARVRLERLLDSAITEQSKREAGVQQLRDHEIRQEVRGLDPNQRNAHFLKALETGQLEVVRAMLDSPTGPMVAPDIETRAKESHARRTNPETWQKLQDLLYLQTHLESLAMQISQWLLSLGASAASVQQATKTPD